MRQVAINGRALFCDKLSQRSLGVVRLGFHASRDQLGQHYPIALCAPFSLKQRPFYHGQLPLSIVQLKFEVEVEAFITITYFFNYASRKLRNARRCPGFVPAYWTRTSIGFLQLGALDGDAQGALLVMASSRVHR
jgi:hypothetical protein